MKLLHVIPYYHPAMAYGGPVKVVYEISQELAQTHDLTVWTSDTFNASRRLTPAEKNLSFNHTVRHHRNLVNAWAYQYRLFTHYGILVTALRNISQFDLIHFHDMYVLPHLLLSRLAVTKHTPYVCSPHGVLDPTRTRKKSLAKKLHQPLVSRMLNQANQLVATSQKEADDLKQLGFKHVTVIENGISHKRPRPQLVTISQPSNKKMTLLYIGKLHPQKGLNELLEAINQSKVPLHLIIAGPDDGMQAQLEKKAKNIDHATIDFPGFVNEAQKEHLYKQADLFVYPSHSEGFSISILEAMRAGLPVLITDQCNFPTVKEYQAGIIVSTDHLVPNLTKALAKSSTHLEKLTLMGQNAANVINQHYSIKTMAKKLENLYATVI